MERGNFTQSN